MNLKTIEHLLDALARRIARLNREFATPDLPERRRRRIEDRSAALSREWLAARRRQIELEEAAV